MRQDSLRHADETEEVDVEDALVLGDGAFLGGTRCTCARIVDKDVDPSEPLDHAADQRANRLVAGHVQIEERHTALRGDSRGVAARSDHVETGLDERERGCFPDA